MNLEVRSVVTWQILLAVRGVFLCSCGFWVVCKIVWVGHELLVNVFLDIFPSFSCQLGAKMHSLTSFRVIPEKQEWLKNSNLVPRATRTSPSKDFTARSDSRSYLAHLDFDWPKDIQILI